MGVSSTAWWCMAVVVLGHAAVAHASYLTPPQPDSSCDTAAFLCSNASGQVLSPSWCAYHNPFIVAQPPTALSNASDTDDSALSYQCDDPSNPFGECHLIDNFLAYEFPSYPNITLKLIVIAQRTSSVLDANSSLSIYDSNFNRLITPIASYPGRLVLLDIIGNVDTNGTTSFITYGGAVQMGFVPGFDCTFGCVTIDFVEMNLMSPVPLNQMPNHNNTAFTTIGWYAETASRSTDLTMFTSTVSLEGREKLAAWGRALGGDDLSDERLGLGNTSQVFTFVSVLMVSADPTSRNYGWSVLVFMHFAATSIFCEVFGNGTPGESCFLPAMRVWLLKGGAGIDVSAQVTLRTTPSYYNCFVPNGTVPLTYAYDTFYNGQNCESSQLFMIATNDTITTFAFTLANYTVDLLADGNTQTISSKGIAPAGAAQISDFVAWTEATLSNPPVATPNSPTPVAPAAVWISMATRSFQPDIDGARGGLFVFRLPQYSDAGANGAYPPAAAPSTWNPSGYPAGAPSCTWNTYWNGTVCTLLPYIVINTESSSYITSLVARWRSLPQVVATALGNAGCLPWNLTCLQLLANATLQQPGGGGGIPWPSPPAVAHTSTHTQFMHAATERRAPIGTNSVEIRQSGSTSTHPLSITSAAPVPPWSVADSMSSSTPSIPDATIAAVVYGNKFVLFAALNTPQVNVYELTPSGCDPHPLALVVAANETSNQLSLMGSLRSFHVTNNAQYFFGAVDRPHYFLASMERIVEMCDQLAIDPTDPFLQQYASACSQSPRMPAVSDFLQVASACLPGTYCPSFSVEDVEVMPSGYYTTFGFERTLCEPGSICSQGRKTPCPIGFMCPSPGMSLPIQCPPDPTLRTTCYYQGSITPTVCSPGTLCGTPYLPPIPAPPGFMQDTVIGLDARTLTRCREGEWCSLGRAASEGVVALLCPAGTVCDEPDAPEPTICNLGGNCNTTSCPVIPYCPQGSTLQNLCPAGSYCPNTTTSFECSVGTYCPTGSPLWQLCPAGSYCANASVVIPCPGGSYCPQGSIAPIECSHMAHCYCDGGCAEPPFSLVAAVAGIIVFVSAFLYIAWRFKVKPWWAARQAAERNRRRAKSKYKRPALGVPLLSQASFNLELVDPRGVTSPDSFSSSGSGGSSDSFASLNGDRVVAAAAAAAASRTQRRPPSIRMTRKTYTIDVKFKALGLKLKKGGANVLAGVTGQLTHGRVCAVMGPSGAGKTTFLTALCGKATYGQLNGTVLINDEPGMLTDIKYKHLVGFVPQEDIMMRDMTVEENIAFAALTRLPASWSFEDKLAFADGVVDLLGLTDIRDSIIGDETVRGVSGGQRKRVNIGIELASDPTVLFLDEPTSGLDATSSMEVCAALRRIADLGLTVALVLHQPRWEIFNSFDDLLLLGKGGKTVFIGAVEDALPYFERALSINCPDRVNPADFLLDVVGGDVPQEWLSQHPDFDVKFLFKQWEKEQETAAAAAAASGADTEISDYSQLNRIRTPPAHQPVGFWLLVWRFFRRSLTQQMRAPLNIVIDNALAAVSALFLAIVYFGTPSYTAPEPIEVFQGCNEEIAQSCQICLAEAGDSVLNRGVMTIISISLTGVATFLRVFGTERVVYWREASALPQPLHSVAYFLGKDLAMLPQLLVGPLVFTMAFEALTTPRASFYEYYGIFFGAYWCASAFGYVTSVLAPPSLAQLLGVVSIFSNAAFAGGAPTLPQMSAKFIPLCYLPYISYMRYALEGLYVSEVVNYEEVVRLQGLSLASMVDSYFGYDLSAYTRDFWITITIGIVLRLTALAGMLLKDGAKKK